MILSLLVVLTGLLSLHAQTEKALVINAGDIKSLTIGDNIEAVLLPAENMGNQLLVSGEALEKIDVRLSRNSLSITARRNFHGKEKLKVKLYVNGLKKLYVESNSVVKTIGWLNTNFIDVYVGGNGVAHLKTKGKIAAHPIDDSEIEITDVQSNTTVRKTF